MEINKTIEEIYSVMDNRKDAMIKEKCEDQCIIIITNKGYIDGTNKPDIDLKLTGDYGVMVATIGTLIKYDEVFARLLADVASSMQDVEREITQRKSKTNQSNQNVN